MNCVERAKNVLYSNSKPIGIVAGDYYPDIWFRDALISCLGMCASKDEKLIKTAESVLGLVAQYQKTSGQVPNKISIRGDKICFGEGGCVDSSMWYPIAALEYYRATKDEKSLLAHYYKIEKAMYWLHCQDVNNDYLIETHDGSDWMDMLLRSGRVLYDNILFYGALKASDNIRQILGMESKYSKYSARLKDSINLLMWPSTSVLEQVRRKYGHTGIERDFEIALRSGERNFYLADLGFRKFDPRMDVFANTLAIFFDVADREKTKQILSAFDRERVCEPYPIRVLTPPIEWGDRFRYFYFRETDLPYLQAPGNYHNGGCWPFAGGFHVAMLKKLGKPHEEAEKKLIAANELYDWRFSEWISSSGNPGGSANQTWSAAMLIYALKFKG